MEFVKKHSKGIIVAICLVLVCAMLGMSTFTFARYTTSKGSTNQATVAKWGYVVTVNADNMFGTKYGAPSDNYVTVQADGTSIVSSSTGNVIAPGSKGSLSIVVNGQSEVLAELNITVNQAQDVELTKTEDSSKYNPITWKINDGSRDLFTGVKTSELSEKFATLGATFDANTSVSKTFTLSWEWPLDSGKDVEDTYLGQISNGTAVDGYTAVTTLIVDLTVEVRQTQA